MQATALFTRLLNVFLRIVPLGTKMLLTVYMGRYFPLGDVGVYGIVFGVVMVLIWVIGLGLGYIVSREIVGAPAEETLFKIRDQALLALLSGVIVAGAFAVGEASHLIDVSRKILFYSVLLGMGESLGNQCNVNMIATGFPIRANIIFFIRSALWIVPAIALGFVSDRFRTANVVLNCWAVGVYASLAVAAVVWPGIPWSKVLDRKIDWVWMIDGIKRTSFIWFGSIGITAGAYVDRIVVADYLNIDTVGVLTFYFSFANALLALIQSGIFSFVQPRLVLLHKEGDVRGFDAEIKKAQRDVVIFGGAMAAIMGIVVALLVPYLNRPLLNKGLGTFALMLVAMWVRANADALYYVLFARHQDRSVWLGNLLYLVPAIGLNVLFVPLFGLPGIGIGGLISALCLLIWRWVSVRSWIAPQPKTA